LPASDEDNAGQDVPRPIKVRIESLSDLVFGLALSIGSIILVGSMPDSGLALAQNVLIFGFGFAILVLTWYGYSRTTAVLPVEVPYALVSNVVLLFVVALEPYLLYVLVNAQSAGLADASSAAYALDVGSMFLLQGALARLVVRQDAMTDHGAARLHPVVLRRFRRISRADVVVGLVFAGSALPIFWVDTPAGYLRFYLWFSSLALIFPLFRSRRLSSSKAARPGRAGEPALPQPG